MICKVITDGLYLCTDSRTQGQEERQTGGRGDRRIGGHDDRMTRGHEDRKIGGQEDMRTGRQEDSRTVVSFGVKTFANSTSPHLCLNINTPYLF